MPKIIPDKYESIAESLSRLKAVGIEAHSLAAGSNLACSSLMQSREALAAEQAAHKQTKERGIAERQSAERDAAELRKQLLEALGRCGVGASTQKALTLAGAVSMCAARVKDSATPSDPEAALWKARAVDTNARANAWRKNYEETRVYLAQVVAQHDLMRVEIAALQAKLKSGEGAPDV